MPKFSNKLITLLEAIVMGLMVAVVLAQANPLYQLPNRDGGFFMYAGSQLLKGDVLYLDIWDSKGPLIFYINALGIWLGHGSRWGVWGMEFIFLAGAAWLGFKLMQKLWGGMPALFGTAMWLFAFSSIARGGNFTEQYSLLFSFIALYIFWLGLQHWENKSYPFVIGATFALNFLLRANNTGIQISMVMVIILSGILDRNYRQSLTRLLWVGFGALTVLVLVALYFAALGTLDDMFRAAIEYNFFYSHEGAKLGMLAKSFTRGVTFFGYPILVAAVLGYAACIERLPASLRSGVLSIRDMNVLLLVGFPLEIVLSGLSGNNFPHYYICWTPYIGLLCGLLLSLHERLKTSHVPALPVMLVLIVVASQTTLKQYQTSFSKLLFNRSEGIELIHPAAKYVRDHTQPSDTILVWGSQPYINLQSRRKSSTGIVFYPQLARSPFTDQLNDRFYQDLVQNKPALIVDMVNPANDTIPLIDPKKRRDQQNRLRQLNPPSNLDAVLEYILANYHVETRVDGVTIYRLNDQVP